MKANRFRFRAWDELSEIMSVATQIDVNGNGAVLVDCNTCKILMQSTGLTDKNGVEIFEGDLIGNHPEFVDGAVMIVNWCDKSGQWYMGFGWDFSRNNPRLGEVIGNIHENPELLESK